jgi:FkbM family methyltransferase
MTSVHRLIERVGDVGTIEVVVDVGAHIGTDSLPIARDFPGMRVFAVEPTPSLAQSLRESGRNLPNYTVIEAAIDAREEERVFNLVGKGMAGFNSLNEFMPGVEGLPPVTEQIRVSTKRLESICDEYGIGRIDILHVDAQGSDLEVLESLGDRLEGVKAGVIEVSNQTRLYVSSVHRDEARAFLESRSFLVFDVQPVDSRGIEQNLFFVNRSLERGLLPRAVPGVFYRGLVLRCRVLTVLARGSERAKRLRWRLALRTRMRRVADLIQSRIS